MPTATRSPQTYRPGLIARMLDGLRYGGGVGQWSWLIHRLTGLGILFFLIVHVIDTFFVVVSPALYDHTVALYGGVWFDGRYYAILRWGFRFAELGLIASVVFHAVNGLGVILYDFWMGGTAHRKGILTGVQVAFLVIMVPTTLYVLYPLTQPPQHTDVKTAAPSEMVATPPAVLPTTFTPSAAPRSATLFLATLGVGVVWLGVLNLAPPGGTKVRPGGGVELFAWRWMRWSGLLLVLLAVGHLFIMHILNNVETINYAFIANRWDSKSTGWLWRLWDFSLIFLAMTHGFNGLRQVAHEYIARPARRVLASALIFAGTTGLIGLGAYAIFMFQGRRDYIAEHPARNASPETVPAPVR